jgi:hypothetical protein
VGLAEALRIDAVELSHALGEIPVRGFHQQVVVLPIWQYAWTTQLKRSQTWPSISSHTCRS